MAKSTAQEPETYQENGLILARDPFGGENAEVMGFVAGEWDIVEEDFGPEIDWPTTVRVAGRLTNVKTVMVERDEVDKDTGFRIKEPSNLYCIEVFPTGEKRSFFGNYQIDNALQRDMYIGRIIFIQWEGKREQSKGGRSLNTYTIGVKREPVAPE